jgi:hypothetical protein
MHHATAWIRAVAACGLIGVALAVSVAADAKWSRADADAFYTKVVQIASHGLAEKRPAKTTTLLERELNAYIAVHGKSELPSGVVDPPRWISMRCGRRRNAAC